MSQYYDKEQVDKKLSQNLVRVEEVGEEVKEDVTKKVLSDVQVFTSQTTNKVNTLEGKVSQLDSKTTELNSNVNTLDTKVDNLSDSVTLSVSPISIKLTDTSDYLATLDDGAYRVESAGTYTNMGGLVVKEGYFTIISKVGNAYKIASEVKMPETEGVVVLNPTSHEIPQSKAVADFTNEKIAELKLGRSLKDFSFTNQIILKNSTIGQIPTTTNNTGWKLSSYIDVDEIDVIIRKGSAIPDESSVAEILFFDENGGYLGYINRNQTEYIVERTDFPLNIKKVRLHSAVNYNGEFSLSEESKIETQSVKGLEQIKDLNSLLKRINAFDKVSAGYLDLNGNKISVDESSVWRSTEFYRVKENQEIEYTGTTPTTGSAVPIWGYDIDFNPIVKLLDKGTYVNKVVKIPNDVAYICGCSNTSLECSMYLNTFDTTIVNFTDKIKELKPSVFFPSKVWAKKGELISFNVNGIVNKHPKDYSRDVFFNHPNGNEDFVRFTAQSDVSIPVRMRLLNQESIVLGNLNVKVKETWTNPTTEHYFIHMGDSTVEATSVPTKGAIVNELSRRLNGVGTSLTPDVAPAPLAMTNLKFIGTLGNSPVKHEGRGGWSMIDYLTKSNKNTVTNAFYNSTTSQFDINYYLANNSFNQITTNGDNLTILVQLGWNEIFTQATSLIESNIRTFLDLIKSQKSEIKIKLISMQLPCPDLYKSYTGSREQSYVSTMQKVMAIARIYEKIALESDYSSWVEHISYASSFFPENSYGSVNFSANKRSTDVKKYYTDDVHPNEIGYAQMADTLYYNILYNYC